MADLSKVKIGEASYTLKDAAARDRLDTAEVELTRLETAKQNVINASNKLAAAYVSLTKPEGTELTATDVQAAIYELEAAIEAGGEGSVVTVESITPVTGYAASYIVKQGGTQVGATINIPKDYLVKSAELKVSTGTDDPSGFPAGTKYIDFVVNAKDGEGTESHIYLNVADLVDVYTADNDTLQMINNQFSVKAVPMAKVTGLEAALNTKADDDDLTAEINRAKEEEAKKVDKDALGDLAYADSATGQVAAQTFDTVKATGDLSGSASITLQSETADAVVKGYKEYTPAGTIAAKATDGSFSALTKAEFKLDNNGVEIGGTNAASAVSFTGGSTADVLGSIKDDAVLPSFVDNKIGTFVQPTLTIAESESFAKAGFTAEVGTGADAETLILTAASTGKASICSGWSAGSWTQGTFNAGSKMTFNEATVIDNIGTGTAAAQVFTGNKYTVETEDDTALKNVEFTGAKTTDVIPSGFTYTKAKTNQSGTVAINNASLDVDSFTVSAKDVTVTPDA